MDFDLQYPRLCGGTFLTLVLQVKTINKQTGKLYPNSFVWKDLTVIFDNIFASSFNGRSAATTTSKYKSCESNNTGYLMLEFEKNISKMNEKIEKDYAACLKLMTDYIASHLILDNNNPWLVYALLDLIRDDKSILASETFYACPNGGKLTKKELLEASTINVPALLVGIWHFIINKRQDNTIGRNTFLSWTDEPSEKKAEHPFTSDIGKGATYSVVLDFGGSETKIIETGKKKEKDLKISLDTEHTTTRSIRKETEIIREGNIDPYEHYLTNVLEKFSKIKTLLYNNEPKPFYGFFVCNNLQRRVYTNDDENRYRYEFYQNITVEGLEKISKFTIITGTGGLGKSMMMRHLLLSSAKRFKDTGRIPLLVNLKEYSSEFDLIDFFYDKLSSLGFECSEEDVKYLASAGKFVFLLDGYDEIYSEEKDSFDAEIDKFSDRYCNNVFVISSRPSYSFVSLARYTLLELSSFTKEQAISLVNKLDFRTDDPDVKQSFIRAIHDSLYSTHREFIGNPLLLTIMLMTFERFADVPSKMHIFYREAYETLATKHDATKGAYRRRLNTGLNSDDFEEYLAEFCARTYKEERFEFDDEDMKVAFGLLNVVKRNEPDFTYKEFTKDLTDNLCLLYLEGNEYHFTHRSFQEYFCALFFSRQKDRNLWAIGQFFNRKRSHSLTDQTFAMLYDMITDKVDEYIFLRFFKELFKKCDNERGYWTYLSEIYPYIYYDYGNTASSFYNRSNQYIYDFVVIHKRLRARSIKEGDLPFDERLIIRRYGSININWFDKEEPDEWETVDMEEIDELYIDSFGEPDEEGWNLELEVADIIAEPDDWKEFIKAMEKDTFPLKQEYYVVRHYYEMLKQSIENKKKNESDELFDLF